MDDYQARKILKPETGQLQRRSKYNPAKDGLRVTAPVTRPPRSKQKTTSSRIVADTPRRLTKSLPPEQEEMTDTEPLLPKIGVFGNQSPFPGGNENPEEKNHPSLLDCLVFLGQGMLNLLQRVPPRQRLACLLLGLGVWILLFLIFYALLQILGPVANAIYIGTGIMASIFVILEHLNKKR